MKSPVKYIISVFLLSVAVVFSASAQQSLRTAYFLDGYTYNYKLNPAFAPERPFFAFPTLGNIGVGAETNLGLSTFLYPTSDGKLTTFLSSTVDDDKFLNQLKDRNKLNVSVNESLLALGFRTGKMFHTIDLSLKADMNAFIPKELFSYVKSGGAGGQTSWNISQTGIRMNSRMELAYGFSRSISEKLRIGARVKLLLGLVQADIVIDDIAITMNRDNWTAVSDGKASISGPFTFGTADGTDRIDFSKVEMMETPEELVKYFSKPSLGVALDLGVSYDFLKYFTASVAVLDLGVIGWNGTTTAQLPGGQWDYNGIGDFSTNTNISSQLSSMGKEILDIMMLEKTGDNLKKTSMLAATIHAGIEARMPFYERLSFGLLATQRINGPYSWTEGRLSANLAPCNWFSLAGSYAFSDFGSSVGGVLNLHLPILNLYVGMDSFLPLMNVTPQFVPINTLNTNLSMGLTFAFGKAKGRYRADK